MAWEEDRSQGRQLIVLYTALGTKSSFFLRKKIRGYTKEKTTNYHLTFSAKYVYESVNLLMAI